jgi:exonuclease SbcD
MRLLHTADWHVGKTLVRHSRLEETRAALEELVAIATDEAVDVVLVCGDIYEHLVPSAEAEAVVYDTLLDLERAGIQVVLIAGNHDHPHRLRAIEPLLRRVSIHAVPEARRPEAGGIVEFASRDGSESLQVAALPWVPERRLFGAEEMMGLQEEPYQGYATHMQRILEALCAGFERGKLHVLAGHLFISGSKLGGGERDLTVGQIYAVTPQAIPTTPQYVALGHVHRPQRPPGLGARAVRYAGSLIQLDFGEREQEKSVAIVELHPGKPAEIRHVRLTAGRRLLDVSGTFDELGRYQESSESAFLRVTLVCDGPQPGLAERVRELLPHALEVRLDYPHQEDPHARAAELRTLTPRELFARYLRERYATEPDAAQLVLFEELLEEELDAAAVA